MTDMATIGAALNGIKSAVDIAKILKNSDVSLEKAEMKYKIAELLEALADAKMSVVEIKDLIEKKDKEIRRLNEAFELKGKLVRQGNYYMLEGDIGDEANKYCLTCWDYDRKLVSLILGHGTIRCNICASRKH